MSVDTKDGVKSLFFLRHFPLSFSLFKMSIDAKDGVRSLFLLTRRYQVIVSGHILVDFSSVKGRLEVIPLLFQDEAS